MKTLSQSPTDPAFVQNPYPFYRSARALSSNDALLWWDDYAMPAAFTHTTVTALLRDRRMGREMPADLAPPVPAHLRDFYGIDAHSMLELNPPHHTRLRGLVLRAFTTRRIAALGPEIAALTHQLIDEFPQNTAFDILPVFATRIPIVIISRLLGVPETMADQLLAWSNTMVAQYQARRTHAIEVAANTAAAEFAAYMRAYIDERRADAPPRDDLISQLIAAEQDGARLSTDELITTCILLLNAGHEATVHAIANAINALLAHPPVAPALTEAAIDRTVEETLRFDPPLHMFTRTAIEDFTAFDHTFNRGDQVALMLASANRDASVWQNSENFDPTRDIKTNTSFGGGIHFCLGAPLARLELKFALPILFERCKNLRLAQPPQYANNYHFHGLSRLMVEI